MPVIDPSASPIRDVNPAKRKVANKSLKVAGGFNNDLGTPLARLRSSQTGDDHSYLAAALRSVVYKLQDIEQVMGMPVEQVLSQLLAHHGSDKAKAVWSKLQQVTR